MFPGHVWPVLLVSPALLQQGSVQNLCLVLSLHLLVFRYLNTNGCMNCVLPQKESQSQSNCVAGRGPEVAALCSQTRQSTKRCFVEGSSLTNFYKWLPCKLRHNVSFRMKATKDKLVWTHCQVMWDFMYSSTIFRVLLSCMMCFGADTIRSLLIQRLPGSFMWK